MFRSLCPYHGLWPGSPGKGDPLPPRDPEYVDHGRPGQIGRFDFEAEKMGVITSQKVRIYHDRTRKVRGFIMIYLVDLGGLWRPIVENERATEVRKF